MEGVHQHVAYTRVLRHQNATLHGVRQQPCLLVAWTIRSRCANLALLRDSTRKVVKRTPTDSSSGIARVPLTKKPSSLCGQDSKGLDFVQNCIYISNSSIHKTNSNEVPVVYPSSYWQGPDQPFGGGVSSPPQRPAIVYSGADSFGLAGVDSCNRHQPTPLGAFSWQGHGGTGGAASARRLGAAGQPRGNLTRGRSAQANPPQFWFGVPDTASPLAPSLGYVHRCYCEPVWVGAKQTARKRRAAESERYLRFWA